MKEKTQNAIIWTTVILAVTGIVFFVYKATQKKEASIIGQSNSNLGSGIVSISDNGLIIYVNGWSLSSTGVLKDETGQIVDQETKAYDPIAQTVTHMDGFVDPI